MKELLKNTFKKDLNLRTLNLELRTKKGVNKTPFFIKSQVLYVSFQYDLYKSLQSFQHPFQQLPCQDQGFQ